MAEQTEMIDLTLEPETEPGLDPSSAPVRGGIVRIVALDLFERFENYVLGMIEILRCILFELELEHLLAYGGALAFVMYILIGGWFVHMRWSNWIFFVTALGMTVAHTMMMSANASLFDRMRITRHWNCSNSFMILASLQIFFLDYSVAKDSTMTCVFFSIDSSVARYLNLTLLLKVQVFCSSVLVKFESASKRRTGRRGSVSTHQGRSSKQTFRSSPFYILVLTTIAASAAEGIVLDIEPFSSSFLNSIVLMVLHSIALGGHTVVAVLCGVAVAKTRKHLDGVILSGARFVAVFGSLHAILIELAAASYWVPWLQIASGVDTAVFFVLLFLSERHEKAFWENFNVSTKTHANTKTEVTKSSGGGSTNVRTKGGRARHGQYTLTSNAGAQQTTNGGSSEVADSNEPVSNAGTVRGKYSARFSLGSLTLGRTPKPTAGSSL